MYVLGSALAVASCWLLLRALQARQPRWRDFGWYALAAAALAYTHYFGLFVLAGQFLYAVGWLMANMGAWSGDQAPTTEWSGDQAPTTGDQAPTTGDQAPATGGEPLHNANRPHPGPLPEGEGVKPGPLPERE